MIPERKVELRRIAKTGAWMADPEDEDYEDDPDYADGYADDPYDGQVCNGCGVDPCICAQLDEEDE